LPSDSANDDIGLTVRPVSSQHSEEITTMMWGNGYGGESSWWMMGGEALVAAMVIAGIVFALLLLARRSEPSPISRGSSARAILEARLARGEIDEQEFQRRSSLLSQT
jgi:putative membrane protein